MRMQGQVFMPCPMTTAIKHVLHDLTARLNTIVISYLAIKLSVIANRTF